MSSDTFHRLANFPVSRTQFERFKSGELWQQWSTQYPELFDADDVRVAATQAGMGYHFHEWVAALLIYQSTGYLSLIESYEFKKQKRKQDILYKLLPPTVTEVIESITKAGKVQCPDLLVYKPDMSDWFFCEVKGPKDKMSSIQEELFVHLAAAGKKPIQVIEFHYH